MRRFHRSRCSRRVSRRQPSRPATLHCPACRRNSRRPCRGHQQLPGGTTTTITTTTTTGINGSSSSSYSSGSHPWPSTSSSRLVSQGQQACRRRHGAAAAFPPERLYHMWWLALRPGTRCELCPLRLLRLQTPCHPAAPPMRTRRRVVQQQQQQQQCLLHQPLRHRLHALTQVRLSPPAAACSHGMQRGGRRTDGHALSWLPPPILATLHDHMCRCAMHRACHFERLPARMALHFLARSL